MAKIIAPNEQFNGLRATVNFVNGVGETADPNLIAWFKSKGYQVDEETSQGPGELTIKEIKEQLDVLGIEYGAKDKKAELLEKLNANKPDGGQPKGEGFENDNQVGQDPNGGNPDGVKSESENSEGSGADGSNSDNKGSQSEGQEQ